MMTGVPPDPKRGRMPAMLKRVLPILLIGLPLVVFLVLGGGGQISFDELARGEHALKAWVAAHPVLAPLSYSAAYIVVVAVSLPIGSYMTILGGLLFGPVIATLLAAVSATTGASLLYLAARTTLGDFLRRRAGPTLKRMEAGFRASAFSYLLALRLIPVFPFALINLVPAFFPIPLPTYVAATFLGILPATMVCAGIGHGLSAVLAEGRRPDLSIIGRPEILLPLLGLAVLALLPVIYARLKARKLR